MLHFCTEIFFMYYLNMFYFDTINDKKILKSDLLKNVVHFFTTRETVLRSQDVNLADAINANKQSICNFYNINPENFVSPTQTHSANIEIAQVGKSNYPETDALILTNTEQAIYLNFADCTPVIIYDTKQNIGAIAHAGWRGTVQRIAPLTIEKMVKECGSNVSDIIVAIGPAISKCCYNVGEDVYNKLQATITNSQGLFEERNDELYVDLKGINRQQLWEIGVEKIDVCPYCTVCDNDMFFSYRNENGTTCRHSAVFKINQK